MEPAVTKFTSVPSAVRPPLKDKDFEWFWGLSPAMENVKRECELSGRKSIHTLIVGETGTGKEVVARTLHKIRCQAFGLKLSDAPFVAVNCGAIPESLAESVLFGHERGAFTSARERQFGKFELAGNGTLFLDEIQTLPLSIQIKLLRVIQHRQIERIGGRTSKKMDCHLIAATSIPLEILVKKRLFRSDLYYRLNVCPIHVPALRHRKEDLPRLLQGLLEQIRLNYPVQAEEVSPDVFDIFLQHHWPGNLRELEHALLYAALRSGPEILVQDLPPHITGATERYVLDGQWED